MVFCLTNTVRKKKIQADAILICEMAMAAHRAQLLLSLVGLPYAGCFALFTPTRTPLRRVQPRPAAVAAPQMLALPSFGSGGKGYDGPSEEVWPTLPMYE